MYVYISHIWIILFTMWICMIYIIYNAYWPAILRYVQLGYKIVQYNQTEVRHKKGILKSWGHD